MWQAQGAHNVTPRLGKNAGVLNQTANGKVRSCCGALGCVPLPAHGAECVR